MVDSTIRPSGPTSWEIEEVGGKFLGTLVQQGNLFTVHAGNDNMLTGVSLGPYGSKDAAMAAIGARLGGTCELFRSGA
jgi:hypothetical protein